MHPVLILLIGVVIVIGGVLVLRLHAFLALVLAALVVGLLTPRMNIERYLMEKSALKVIAYDAAAGEIELKSAPYGRHFYVFRYDVKKATLVKRCELVLDPLSAAQEINEGVKGRYRVKLLGALDSFQLDDNDIIIHRIPYEAAKDEAEKTVGERVAAAFGTTCGKIGILIALAAIIGKCLLDSGAADKIVRSSMKITGERGASISFLGSGFLLGIPVFFDTVFYLMIPLGKAMRMRTGRNYLLYILSIVAGGSMAHSLVPPTPGPLLVAGELGVDLGLMIVAGCIVGLFSSSAAYLYAHWINRRYEVPLRESADFSLAELEELSQRDESRLPPLWLALAPIVLPVTFIAGATVINSLKLLDDSPILPVVQTLGNKNIALAIAAVFAMAMLVWQKKTSLKELGTSASAALSNGGVIILITAAGGAFGGMLQQSGVVSLINDLPDFSYMTVLMIAWLITAGIRTAQGSATVAMITAVGILAGFAADGNLGCHPVYLALAIGCGSKPIAWMNDSGFWVICKMSGMTETEGIKYLTPMSILMGVVGLGATLFFAAIWPMV